MSLCHVKLDCSPCNCITGSGPFTLSYKSFSHIAYKLPCLPLQDIEKALMRADVDRDKLKDRHNRPDAVAKGLELNDASRVQRRGKMMLPAPQVSEQELQQIAKGGGDVDLDPDLAEGGTDATRRLLGDYQTPQRSGVRASSRPSDVLHPLLVCHADQILCMRSCC